MPSARARVGDRAARPRPARPAPASSRRARRTAARPPQRVLRPAPLALRVARAGGACARTRASRRACAPPSRRRAARAPLVSTTSLSTSSGNSSDPDAGRGDLDPAQARGAGEVVAAHRPAEHDVGLGQQPRRPRPRRRGDGEAHVGELARRSSSTNRRRQVPDAVRGCARTRAPGSGVHGAHGATDRAARARADATLRDRARQARPHSLAAVRCRRPLQRSRSLEARQPAYDALRASRACSLVASGLLALPAPGFARTPGSLAPGRVLQRVPRQRHLRPTAGSTTTSANARRCPAAAPSRRASSTLVQRAGLEDRMELHARRAGPERDASSGIRLPAAHPDRAWATCCSGCNWATVERSRARSRSKSAGRRPLGYNRRVVPRARRRRPAALDGVAIESSAPRQPPGFFRWRFGVRLSHRVRHSRYLDRRARTTPHRDPADQVVLAAPTRLLARPALLLAGAIAAMRRSASSRVQGTRSTPGRVRGSRYRVTTARRVRGLAAHGRGRERAPHGRVSTPASRSSRRSSSRLQGLRSARGARPEPVTRRLGRTRPRLGARPAPDATRSRTVGPIRDLRPPPPLPRPLSRRGLRWGIAVRRAHQPRSRSRSRRCCGSRSTTSTAASPPRSSAATR